MLEPYAMKVARTVLRGGKLERAYLSQLETQVVLTINTKEHLLLFHLGSTIARLKLKEIDGDTYKWWCMLFNSITHV